MSERAFIHKPVLHDKVLEALQLRTGDFAIDVTAGGGGHLRLICEAVGEQGHVLATDRDERALEKDAAGGVALQYGTRVHLVHTPFSEISRVTANLGLGLANGLLCDLGVSSWQLDTNERGFSFMGDGPIDMRMDQSAGQSAYELITSSSERELADLIFLYGEERFSRRIAKWIKDAWPLPDSTLALAELVKKAVPRWEKRLHPATRTFQALRIAVNDELGELKTLLAVLPTLLKPGGRGVFISFHSLEDRLVKLAFRNGAKANETRDAYWKIITKKPVTASLSELENNPRARSAKMRVVEMLGKNE